MPCTQTGCSDPNCKHPRPKLSKAESLEKARASRRNLHNARKNLTEVQLDFLYKKLTNVLKRDSDWLLMVSAERKLNRDESQSLSNYLKVIKELKKLEDSDGAEMSEEELRKVVGVG